MTALIEDHALIGDCRSAALVTREGVIDWLCWPRFDSPPIFASVLDEQRGGSWSIAPRGLPFDRRTYVGDSAVLATTFSDDSAEVVVTDAMPIASPEDEARFLLPEHELVRVVECRRGEATVEIHLIPRPMFGRDACRVIDRGKLGIRIETPQGLLTVHSDAGAPAVCADDGIHWTVTLAAGQAVHFSLTCTIDAPAVLPPVGEWTRACLERTLRHWSTWSARTRYDGDHRALLVRSAITVRLLSFSPSGAIIAAPTTSLPETIGGKLNWDYRFCWLRDAAFTVRGLLALGHDAEAMGFTDWLLHATRLTRPRLKVLYDVFGREPEKEAELEELAGYAGSRPVRTGNGAAAQVQLDAYGEVVDAVWRTVRAGHPLDHETGGVVEGFGRYVCAHWTDADAGIWEPREPPQRHTHSLALCWTALERLLDLQKTGDLRDRHRALFATHREKIARTLRERAWSDTLGSYTAVLDGDALDATSLLLGWYGFEDPSSTRMRSTFTALCRQLSPRPGLLYRNRKPGDDEGTFGVCSFWIAEHLAKGGGTLAEARAAFASTIAFANDVGLMSEQVDATSGRALGNFPQTFTHVGLINAALSIVDRERRDRGDTVSP